MSLASQPGSRHQRLRALLQHCRRHNGFYQQRIAHLTDDEIGRAELNILERLPFTTKEDLVEDQARHPPWGTNLGAAKDRFVRLHRTSGTSGRPLLWPDTQRNWTWFVDCWRQILEGAGVTPADRVFVAFSFGPFIGFWGAFEAAQGLGALALSGGAMSSEERIQNLLDNQATVIVCTPTYGLRLLDVAARLGIDLAASTVRLTLHAGEPGAGLENVRRLLEDGWGARCSDHAGATEVGPWGLTPPGETSMLVLDDFIAEIVEPESGDHLELRAGEVCRGELVLTNLGRIDSPVLRYRTGDLVEATLDDQGRLRLSGGVLARRDGMVVVRGVNVYPSAIENLVRGHPEIIEFRATISRHHQLLELLLEIEVETSSADAVAAALGARLHRELGLRAEIEVAPPNSLPRWELKARRFNFAADFVP